MFSIYIVSILLITAIFTFIPAFLILKRFLPQNYMSDIEILSFSPALSLALFGYIVFTNYILNTSQNLINILFIIFFFLIATLIKTKKKLENAAITTFFVPFILIILLYLGFQSLIKLYTGAFSFGDWYMHYEISQFYLLHKPLSTSFIGQVYFVPSRTPFFNLICAYFLSLFKNNFYTFQIISYFLNSLFILPFLLIYKKYFGGQNKFGLNFLILFCIINPYIYYRITLTTPKMLTAFFFLIALYFYLKIRTAKTNDISKLDLTLLGLCLGLTILCHNSFIFYILGLLIDFIILKLKNKTNIKWKYLFFTVIIFALTILPWITWLLSNFKLNTILNSTPTVLLTSNNTLADWIIQHSANLFFTIFPLGLLWGAIQFIQNKINIVSIINIWQGTYVGTIPGIISFSLFILVIYQIISKKSHSLINALKNNQLYLILIVIGLIGSIIPEPTMYLIGLGHNSLDIAFLLIILLIAKYIFNKPLNKLIYILIILENLIVLCGFVLFQIFYNCFNYISPQKNLILKTSNHVIYIFDILGNYWLLLLIITLLFQVFLIRKYSTKIMQQGYY